MILIIFIYIIFTYKYQTYYVGVSSYIDNCIEVIAVKDDIKYFLNNNIIMLDGVYYQYSIDHIENDNIYLKVLGLEVKDTYQVKLVKENKIIAKYLKELVVRFKMPTIWHWLFEQEINFFKFSAKCFNPKGWNCNSACSPD